MMVSSPKKMKQKNSQNNYKHGKTSKTMLGFSTKKTKLKPDEENMPNSDHNES